jgi:hypothetical protein
MPSYYMVVPSTPDNLTLQLENSVNQGWGSHSYNRRHRGDDSVAGHRSVGAIER